MVKPIIVDRTDEQILSDLHRYAEVAAELGADGAKVIEAQGVVVDERVKAKCRVPRCFHFGSCANCPPMTPDVDEVRNMIGRYRYALLVKHEVRPAEHFADRKSSLVNAKSHEKEIARIVAEIENRAFSDGYYLALGLACGSCRSYLCNNQVCQYLDSGRCRFPRISRPSMEGMGIDVFLTVAQAGWEIYPIGPEAMAAGEVPVGLAVGIVFVV
ncbi:hypothetical protein SY88_20655 [Clostridiales bacterium PH28_bin88]|nr:hypothetical protein SY88_20655 [Clostridiales bacterium PH28_bin88]